MEQNKGMTTEEIIFSIGSPLNVSHSLLTAVLTINGTSLNICIAFKA